MNQQDCIFCKVISGEFDSAKVWEDDKFVAILDLNPNTTGMTVVLTKDHHDSYIVEMDDETYASFFKAAKKVAKILEKALEVKRVALVMEGMGINHAHIKLYPLHGLEQTFEETWVDEREFFDMYKGYISTKMGPQKNMEELKALANKIKLSYA